MIKNSKRKMKKREDFIRREKEIRDEIQFAAEDILNSDNFSMTDEFIQHGNVSVRSHSLNVAKYSLLFSKKLPAECNERELIRGALLHDYFLYDWHKKEGRNYKGLHGFYHPSVALENAAKEYPLTDREKDIIKKHMWPLTVVPPMCREAWIVTAADKYCSFMETVRLHRGYRGRGETVALNL